MPWKEPMDERVRFIAAISSGLRMTEACRLFGVSRKTGYKWLERYKTYGPSGLEDESRAPKTIPWALEEDMVDLLVEVRRRHPTWGPRKVLDRLRLRHPDLELPAASTVGDLFRRRGLVERHRRRRRFERQATPLAHVRAPNDGWCVDFKGHFRVADGQRCDPLTITDAYSRFLLCCMGMDRPTTEYVWPAFEATFREFGVPVAIRSDNGPPFASRGLGGLSRLSVRWVRLGIRLERITPGKPQENGRHERMHRTLKAEAVWPPAADLRHQQERFDRFREEFNHERPHEALEGQPPGQVYSPSARPYPSKLPDVEYPDHFAVRMVRTDGTIQWRGSHLYVSEALVGEAIGLEEVEGDRWLLRFANLPLAIIDDTGPESILIPTPSPSLMRLQGGGPP
jgi:putative transposase